MALPSPDQVAGSGTTEHSEQVAVFTWASQNVSRYPELKWLHAIPNGGSRGDSAETAMVVGSFMKAEGVRKGIFDICLPVARAGFFGFYLEMKKPGKIKNTSKEQKEFMKFLQKENYASMVCDSWQDAVKNIEWYLQQERTK